MTGNPTAETELRRTRRPPGTIRTTLPTDRRLRAFKESKSFDEDFSGKDRRRHHLRQGVHGRHQVRPGREARRRLRLPLCPPLRLICLLCVCSHQDVAGFKLPKFKHFIDPSADPKHFNRSRPAVPPLSRPSSCSICSPRVC
ncbi:autophagy-related protein 3 [Iris pallida]|uniref:Autophagy-related protein 3 n=1 Tax=Iris pallida TaxID=29817 RepID=A0AAX6E977_IRIPA|nr:autophagy-related protein 3 [Iris pallida]KAJ6800584.1 autophagy-related protein 3 [Iris pallida]